MSRAGRPPLTSPLTGLSSTDTGRHRTRRITPDRVLVCGFVMALGQETTMPAGSSGGHQELCGRVRPPAAGRRLRGHREHVGLRIVRLGGEARRSAARRVLAAARAGALAALQTIIPSFTGKIPAAPALLEAR